MGVREAGREVSTPSGPFPGATGRGRLLLLVFALGFAALIAQSLLVREFLVVCFGNELSLGVVFAGWLIGIATGGAVGGRLARRAAAARSTLGAGVTGAALLLPLQLVLIRASRALLRVPVGELIPLDRMLLVALFLGAPGSFCLGLAFAPACRLLSDSWAAGRGAPPSGGSAAIGWVYAVEAVGALVGGSLFSLVLAGRVAAFPVAAAVAVALMGLARLAVGSPAGRLRRWAWPVAAAAVVGSAWPLELWSRGRRWRSLQPGVQLVRTLDSRYQNLALGKLADQYSIYGNGEVMGTFPDPYLTVQQAALFMVQHPAPKRVLLVGGGIEGLAQELLRYPIDRLDYVSLDRAVPRLIKPYLPPDLSQVFTDRRFHAYYTDGRYFVKSARGPYDLVIVNVPEPRSAMVNRFYTLEFFREVTRILGPDGVLITRAGETFGYIGRELGQYAGSVFHTLRRVFPEVLATPSGTTYFFAGRRPGLVSLDPEVLARRYRALGVRSPYFTPELYGQLFLPEWVEFINEGLRRVGDVPLNTDQRPVTYFYGLLLWDRYSGSRLTPFFTWVHRLKPGVPLALLALGTALVAGWQVLRRGDPRRSLRANLTWTVATTGAAAMAVELILVFAFQNSFGYIYEKVGLIVGVFMFGLALGGAGATALVGRRRRVMGPLLGVNLVLVLFAAGLPWWLGLLARLGGRAQEAGFAGLVWTSGLLTGAVFPLAADLFRRADAVPSGAGVAHAAGRLDWADHVGACAGALLTGVIVVPVMGVAEACLGVAALSASSLALLSVSARRLRRT